MDHCFMVKTAAFREIDFIRLFLGTDDVVVLPVCTDMLDVLVRIGIFRSKTQARKNWKGPAEIPLGFTEFLGIGKLRHNILIWNPAIVDPLPPEILVLDNF